MWKRVHLAVLRGPDLGHTIELGAAGQGVAAGPAVAIGSSHMSDHCLDDPALAPLHLHVRAGVNRFGMPGVWVSQVQGVGQVEAKVMAEAYARAATPFGTRPAAHATTAGAWFPHISARPARGPLQARGRHYRIGEQFQVGNTTFAVRTDPRPPRDSHERYKQALLRSLPLAASLGFLAMWIIPGAGPWPLMISGILTPAAMLLASRSAQRELPDPAALLRAHVGGGTSRYGSHRSGSETSSESWRIEVGTSLGRGSWRRKTLTIHPGDVIGISGSGADGLARWISAQLCTQGGELQRLQPPTSKAPRVEYYALTFPAGSGPALFKNAAVGGDPLSGSRNTAMAARSTLVTSPHSPSVVLITAPTPALLPPHVSFSLTAQAGHNRDVSSRWLAPFSAGPESLQLPSRVDLRAHTPFDTAHAWSSCDTQLSTAVGVEMGEGELDVVTIDLAGDSPHAIIAGTTGAGKSELLTAWLLGLAARYPPAYLAMVLVDYKGGATFGQLARLPHVLDVLTDLEHGATVRALESLRVEIQRRERLFSEAGVTNLQEYNERSAVPLSRLLIALDEFRVLADEYPEVMEQILRVAAQGRSLGMHVILATQRPGGAMTPDIRANMGVRACLRVIEEADSIDLLGTSAAAYLPAIPGRMILQGQGQRTVQTLWAGSDCSDLVARYRKVAKDQPHLAALHRPWAPALPTLVTRVPTAPAGEIALGVADLPAEQRHGVCHLPPRGLLVVAGEAESGRTNTARVLAHGLLHVGIPVHTFSREPLAEVASHVHPGDPPAAFELLTAMREASGLDALIIDDAEALLQALEAALGMGEAPVFLQEVLRACRQRGAFVAITTSLPIPSWLPASNRIIFPPTDPAAHLLAGLSKAHADPGPKGRAVAIRGHTHTLIQVPLIDRGAPGSAPAVPELRGALPRPSFRVHPLPTSTSLPADPRLGICIGVRNASRPVALTCEPGKATLIVSPPAGGGGHVLHLISQRAHLVDQANSLRIVKDLHLLEHADLDGHSEALRAGQHLVATTTPEGLAHGFHPLLSRLRHAEQILYLTLIPRSLIGLDLAKYITPGIWGRAALMHRGRITPVQIESGAALAQRCPEHPQHRDEKY